MRSFTYIVMIVTCVTRAQAGQASTLREGMDSVVAAPAGLVGELLDRGLRASPIVVTDLEGAMLGKSSHLTVSTNRQLSLLPAALPRPLPSRSLPSVYRQFQPISSANLQRPGEPAFKPMQRVATAAKWSKSNEVAVMSSGSLTELEDVEVKSFSKDDPFKSTFLSMKEILSSPAGKTYSILLSTENSEQQPFRYVEGQILVVYKNYQKPEEKPEMLFLSIASSRYGDTADGKTLTLCVFVKEGGDNYFGSLAAGDPVMLTGPMGKAMLLPESPSGDILGFSIGTGIAPFRAFGNRLFADNSPASKSFTGRLVVLTAAKDKADLPFADDFEALASTNDKRVVYSPYIADTQDQVALILGAVEQNAVSILDVLKGGGHVYIAGPMKKLMDDLVQALKSKDEGAEDLIAAAKTEGRWHVEVY